ncbi:MAG: glutamyl-tRNA reductase, partial [Chloroflexota bacterium]
MTNLRGRGALVLVGASHHTAPVAVRERLAAAGSEAALDALLGAIRQPCGPAVVLSTCNRLEVYCWTTERPSVATARLIQALAAHAGRSPKTLRPYVYTSTGVDAARHLIRVAAGLDSLALGESQIIGQVREAWLAAAACAPLGPQLNEVFRQAIDAARRLRSLGAFDRHPSVAGIAVHVAAEAVGGLRGKHVAVLGAGATGKTAARALALGGAGQITLLNRSLERARDTAASLGLGERLSPQPLSDLPTVLAAADAVICATAAASPVISAAAVAAALPRRGGRPLVVVDIAVPRDTEPPVRALAGVDLIDLDDLEARCALDGTARQREMERVEAAARQAAEECLAA